MVPITQQTGLADTIRSCVSWQDIQDKWRNLPEKLKADLFEELVKAYLQLDPEYASKLKHVWLGREVPQAIARKLKLPATDQGIDIVAETHDGDFWAVQCKYRQETDHRLTWRDLSTFTGLAFGVCSGFAFGIVCSTTERITHVLKDQERIGFCALDIWQALDASMVPVHGTSSRSDTNPARRNCSRELLCGMARQRRFQYAGAVYHVMARGDGGKTVFETDDDRLVFLSRLGEVCGSCGWRVHAWVLMGNHFHLLLETPLPNLVAGMKWLLGTFSQGWNRTRKRQGHVFQGRYKSVPVNGSDADAHYFRIMADYIHLNPARAGLAGGEAGKLAGYRWSTSNGRPRFGKPPGGHREEKPEISETAQ
jgi:REP element-mobilizing transposase RayT